MKDLVLFPNEEMSRVHADDPRFADAMKFFVKVFVGAVALVVIVDVAIVVIALNT